MKISTNRYVQSRMVFEFKLFVCGIFFCFSGVSLYSLPAYLNLKAEILNLQEESNRNILEKSLKELSKIIIFLSNDQKEEILSILQTKMLLFPYEITEFIAKHPFLYQYSRIQFLTLAIGNSINLKNFINPKGNVVVLFSANWCSQCKHLKKTFCKNPLYKDFLIREIDIADWESEAWLLLKNLSDNSKLAVPYLLFFRDGTLVYKGLSTAILP